MSYMTPSEQEAELAAVFESLLDSHDEVLASIADQCRLALDEGGPDAMRACLSTIVTRLIDIASLDESDDVPKIIIKWAGKV